MLRLSCDAVLRLRGTKLLGQSFNFYRPRAYLFTHPSGFTKQQSDPPPAPPQA
jgi:hypothetical protein